MTDTAPGWFASGHTDHDQDDDQAPERDSEVRAALAASFLEPAGRIVAVPLQASPLARTAAPAPVEQEGPVPALAGSFAVYITPDKALVLAYRPEGADGDKQLLVPALIVEMAARQTGHTPEELLRHLAEEA